MERLATNKDYSKGRGCCLFVSIICIILFLAPAILITWDNLTWKSRAEENFEKSGPQKYQEIIKEPTAYKCMQFLKNFKGMKDECRVVSHVLDSLVLSRYIENDTDVVRLAHFVCCNHHIEGTPTVDKINRLSKIRLNELWNKDPLLAYYGMRHYTDLISFIFSLNEDYAWRMVQFSNNYKEYREHYPNSKYDKIAYRRIIEQAIELGEYEELQPMKKISSSDDGYADISIENLTNHPITVSFLSIQKLDDIKIISIPKSSNDKIKILADDYKIYAKTDDKSGIRPYASKYTKISSGIYELQFIVVTDN